MAMIGLSKSPSCHAGGAPQRAGAGHVAAVGGGAGAEGWHGSVRVVRLAARNLTPEAAAEKDLLRDTEPDLLRTGTSPSTRVYRIVPGSQVAIPGTK